MALIAIAACQNESAQTTAVPVPDRAAFETTIYPLLLRDCAFSACHGAEHRFLQVFGPGRTRLPLVGSDEERVLQERQLSYERARSMLVNPEGTTILAAPLLTKPLEVVAGGAAHKGVDNFGRNVFQSRADPRYLTLLAWAQSSLPPTAAAAGAAAPTIPVTPVAGSGGPTVGVAP
ncbi:MAG TPA: hypothetical protein VJV78_35285 [Polyangiales bacterium]|nr:hypothetical protein [Polyangiales bacterium]